MQFRVNHCIRAAAPHFKRMEGGKKWAAIIATASGNDEKTTRVDFKCSHPSTCTDTDVKKYVYVCAPCEVLLFLKVQRC